MSKYNVGLKTLLLQSLSEPEFYGDLMYKFRKIICKNDFHYHFKKIIVRNKKKLYHGLQCFPLKFLLIDRIVVLRPR